MFVNLDHLKVYGLILVPLFLLFGAWNMQSNFFGPRDFQQCLLEKMKGLPQNMEAMAASECQKQFPPAAAPVAASDPAPRMIQGVNYEYCDLQWGNNYNICINGVPGGYRIVKVEAVFYHAHGAPCGDMTEENWRLSDHWPGTKSWFNNKYSFDMKAEPDICGVFVFYGIDA